MSYAAVVLLLKDTISETPGSFWARHVENIAEKPLENSKFDLHNKAGALQRIFLLKGRGGER